jgi:hypothetical protein
MTRPKSIAFAGLIAVALVTTLTRFVSPALLAAAQVTASVQTVPPLDADLTPLTSKNLVGHRLWIIVFDKSSMPIEDMQRATTEAVKWMTEKTPNVDVVAVAVISSTGLEVLQDFTTNTAKIQKALAEFNAAPADASATRLNAAADLDALSNDVRLNGLKTICDALTPWKEKKEMLYFTSGMARADADNQVQYREAVDACESAHVTIDSLDARGLMSGGLGAGQAGGRSGSSSASSARGGSGSNGSSGSAAVTPRPAGRSESASSAIGINGLNAPTPRLDALPPTRPDFSGAWQCDKCPPSLGQSPAALWLGMTFTVSYVPTDKPISISFQPAPAWTFNLAGAASVNVGVAPLVGDWVSMLSWDGDKLVLTMTGTVSKGGKPNPVVAKQVLSVLTADGARTGELEVVTTTAPSGLLPDGVSIYKKIG